MALTARISPHSDAIIHELVNKTGKSKIEIIEEALESYRFRERMRLFNESYERLRSNKKEWAKELADRDELEGTLMDGLEDE
ncbi:MAG: ribbon-helix-helix protein, CopG family [Parachlamydiaceae bacterium]|nr:ribbon-helix-helix protein, CopG family [Parachlamydiaceae bacterium]